MPRANAEYRWVCVQSIPGRHRPPSASTSSASGCSAVSELEPMAPIRPSATRIAPFSTRGARSSMVTTVALAMQIGFTAAPWGS